MSSTIIPKARINQDEPKLEKPAQDTLGMPTYKNTLDVYLKRSRGRPRKTVVRSFPNAHMSATLKQAPYFTPKRKQIVESATDEIQIIDLNGFENSQPKKPKPDDPLDPTLPKRCLPHRAARFTDSYGGTSPDVVVISDEEKEGEEESESDSDSDCGPIPSPIVVVKSKEELELFEENVQNLKKILCDEEMKLVLLKKLQDSQKTKDLKRDTTGSPVPVSPALGAQKSTTVTLKSGVQIQPLPSKQLLTNNIKLSSKKEMKLESTSQFSKAVPKAHSSNPPMRHSVKLEANNNAANATAKAAERINSSHLQQYPLLKNLSAQITITAVPPIGSPAATNHSQQPSLPATSKQTHTNVTVIKEEKTDDSLSQRQAAAKLALRKQLEKTLLQIPLPKPPPLKINFFPNANSLEFLCLLGLDFVVDCLIKSKKTPQNNPLTCAQCSTDFTCAWKWKEVEKNGTKSYDAFCEACINSNVRKSLKAQHTNSLKAAFLKALHQEKEIDRLSSSSQVPSSKSSHSSTPRPNPRLPSPAHQNSSPSIAPLPKHGAPVPYIPKVASGLNHAALAQMSKLNPQYQSLLQIQAQHLLATGVPLHPSMLTTFMSQSPNHSRGKSSIVPNDLRRQYRSDRVQSPSLPHSSSSWKA